MEEGWRLDFLAELSHGGSHHVDDDDDDNRYMKMHSC